jgi:hypothetical protein
MEEAFDLHEQNLLLDLNQQLFSNHLTSSSSRWDVFQEILPMDHLWNGGD